MVKRILLPLLALPLLGQARNAADLQKLLDRLQTVGSALYIAAHPDDENTALITALSKGKHLRTGYLALTRGGGGQNLIGPELDDGLALIRTQELLAARRLDGGEQFFSRAVDFGFSKSSEESFRIWGHDTILADVVYRIRAFRPDILVTRFDPNDTQTHGHHTASALLALEAFRAAADPKRFPEQLDRVQPWQTKRIFWNTYHTFRGVSPDPSEGILTVDLGIFDPLLGKSYAELAAESRSQHRSQGFGAVAPRGSRADYLKLLDGAPAKSDPFEGIDLSWARVPGSTAVADHLAKARQAYRPDQPSAALPHLLSALTALEKLPADPWTRAKRKELIEAIRLSAGLWIEAIADRQAAAPGQEIKVTVTAIARGGVPVGWDGVRLNRMDHGRNQTLKDNQPLSETLSFNELPDEPQPYWLGPHRDPLHAAGTPEEAGLPEGRPAVEATFHLAFGGQKVDLPVPVQYRFRDPVLGERYQPFVILPPAALTFAQGQQVFHDGAPRKVSLRIEPSGAATGTVRFSAPKGWSVSPTSLPLKESATAELTITPPATPSTGELKVEVDLPGHPPQPGRSRVQIDYPHIPLQTYFPPAAVRLVKLDLKHNGTRIGYVMGAGDDIPASLRQLGYSVDLLSDEQLAGGDLATYDAIVLGIRAFNTRPKLSQVTARLNDYVAKGGTEVMQYAVNGTFPGINAPLTTETFGPFPFKIGRDRVTDETAPITFLDPTHKVLNWPNKIGPADFEGWVQERGLYYATSWDSHFTPIFAMNDPGEAPLKGGLLVAKHGKGAFVYTGLAFFRQLPDGVPGAYRLFANLLAAGHARD